MLKGIAKMWQKLQYFFTYLQTKVVWKASGKFFKIIFRVLQIPPKLQNFEKGGGERVIPRYHFPTMLKIFVSNNLKFCFKDSIAKNTFHFLKNTRFQRIGSRETMHVKRNWYWTIWKQSSFFLNISHYWNIWSVSINKIFWLPEFTRWFKLAH